MSRIGCGFHVKEVPSIVKSQLDYKEIPSKFENNLPSIWWVKKFMARHRDLSLRTPEILGHGRVKITKENILEWFEGNIYSNTFNNDKIHIDLLKILTLLYFLISIIFALIFT